MITNYIVFQQSNYNYNYFKNIINCNYKLQHYDTTGGNPFSHHSKSTQVDCCVLCVLACSATNRPLLAGTHSLLLCSGTYSDWWHNLLDQVRYKHIKLLVVTSPWLVTSQVTNMLLHSCESLPGQYAVQVFEEHRSSIVSSAGPAFLECLIKHFSKQWRKFYHDIATTNNSCVKHT